MKAAALFFAVHALAAVATAQQSVAPPSPFSLMSSLDAMGYLLHNQNHPPLARCAPRWVKANENCKGHASIDAGSRDLEDGTALTYTQQPAGPYDLGTKTVKLTVKDSGGETDLCYARVTVKDNTAPSLSLHLDPKSKVLWPATCQLTDIHLKWSVRDNCDKSVTKSISVFSNELPAATDGYLQAPDAVFSAGAHGRLQLRACRDESRTGRVFLIVAKAKDEAGNEAVKCAAVTVPRSDLPTDKLKVQARAAEAAAHCNRWGRAPFDYHRLPAPSGF